MYLAMNVYTRATFWGTFVTLVLLAGVLALDIWLMTELPSLQHGFGYAVLHLGMLGLFLKLLRLMFKGGPPSSKD